MTIHTAKNLTETNTYSLVCVGGGGFLQVQALGGCMSARAPTGNVTLRTDLS